MHDPRDQRFSSLVLLLEGYTLFIDNYIAITQIGKALSEAEIVRRRMKTMSFCGSSKRSPNGIAFIEVFSQSEKIVGIV